MTAEELDTTWTFQGREKRCDLISKFPPRVQVLLATEWAKSVLPIWFQYSSDHRPALAVEVCLAWVFSPSEANREAAGKAACNTFNVTDVGYAAAAAAAAAIAAAAATAYARDSHAATAASFTAANVAFTAPNADIKKKWQWIEAVYKRCAGPNYNFASEWRTTEAVALAQGMWSRGVCDCLPILADALQEAGLDDPKVLLPLRLEPSTSCLSDWTMWNLLQFDN